MSANAAPDPLQFLNGISGAIGVTSRITIALADAREYNVSAFVRSVKQGDEMSTASQGKPARLNIRASEHEKEVITRAAEALNKTVSAFVLERAYADAQAVLAEQSQFRLPEKKWREFCKALDAPPKDIPALRRLLTEPGVFDE